MGSSTTLASTQIDYATFTVTAGRAMLAEASEAAKRNKSLPASPGQSTLESERYNEQFFSSVVGGADLEKATADYDAYVTKTLNAYGD